MGGGDLVGALQGISGQQQSQEIAMAQYQEQQSVQNGWANAIQSAQKMDEDTITALTKNEADTAQKQSQIAQSS